MIVKIRGFKIFVSPTLKGQTTDRQVFGTDMLAQRIPTVLSESTQNVKLDLIKHRLRIVNKIKEDTVTILISVMSFTFVHNDKRNFVEAYNAFLCVI